MNRWFIFAIAIAFADIAVAQHVVQLPEYHVTSVNTTVSVPDRGGAYLGGVNSSSAGSANQGFGLRPFGNSAIGGTSAGGGMWVGAQIHDLQAMDEALLGQSAGNARPPLVLAPEFLNSGGGSVADLKARAESEDAARQRQAVDELAHARQLVAEGKPGVAKIYFQMAAKHASGDVKQQALAGLQAVNQTKGAVAGK